jgi:hypothetical protein
MDQFVNESVTANVAARNETQLTVLTAHFNRSSLGALSNNREPG